MTVSASSAPHPLLTDPRSRDAFLANDWGKRPVLFRNLLPAFRSPLSPDELAGLSCEPGTTSRLVLGGGSGPYELRLGPFEEEVFGSLPEEDWTLLVHDVNRIVPPLADLLDKFSFIPSWRVDDVMVSYAAPGGGVGPHVDNYDVFLVQGSGKRMWKTAYSPISPEDELLVEPCDVRVLRDGFVPDEEWTLEPGDVLYVPPRFPHHGISLDDQCMTFSVGFRAPAIAGLVRGWTDDVIERGRLDNLFFQDFAEDLVRNANDPGRITDTAVNAAYETVMDRLARSEEMRKRFAIWFAREVSQPKRFRSHEPEFEPLAEPEANEKVDSILAAPGDDRIRVRQQEGAVFTYLESDNELSMYIDGERWPVESLSIARAICRARVLEADELKSLSKTHPSLRALLVRLLLAGMLYVDEDQG